MVPFENTHAVIFEGADPYAEEGEDRWFVQLAIEAGRNGAVLHTAKTTQMDGITQADASVSFQAGQVLLFDAGNAHWVTPDGGGSQTDARIILLGIKSKREMDREEAEALLTEHLMNHLPSLGDRMITPKSSGRVPSP